MNRYGGTGALRIWVVALTWSVASLALGAGAQEVQDPQGPPEEEALDEVFIEGRRDEPRPRTFKELRKPFDWLARLVGEFDIDGSVDLHAQGRPGDLRKVAGRADCVGFGTGPGVQCDLRVLWQETRKARMARTFLEEFPP